MKRNLVIFVIGIVLVLATSIYFSNTEAKTVHTSSEIVLLQRIHNLLQRNSKVLEDIYRKLKDIEGNQRTQLDKMD